MKKCPICHSASHELFTVSLRPATAELSRCSVCRFAFFANPTWLETSFGTRLTDPDVGVLDRNLIVADFLTALIHRLGLDNGEFVDWGAGYGLLSRLMRDQGFDFANHEEFAQPIFYSPRFEPGEHKVDLIVLSEVALHFDKPLQEFEALTQLSNRIFFTAVVPPTDLTPNWWYLMPSTGLHVAFYSTESLHALAKRLNMRLTTDGRFFHLLHRDPLPFTARLLFRSRVIAFGSARVHQLVSDVRRLLNKRRTLIQVDVEDVVERSRPQQ